MGRSENIYIYKHQLRWHFVHHILLLIKFSFNILFNKMIKCLQKLCRKYVKCSMCYQKCNYHVYWLVWLIGLSVDRLIGWTVDRLVDWSFDRSVVCKSLLQIKSVNCERDTHDTAFTLALALYNVHALCSTDNTLRWLDSGHSSVNDVIDSPTTEAR